jgi:thymidylate synthase
MFNLIVACTKSYGIGPEPFKSSEDRKLFRKLTLGNVVVMGRVTYEIIGVLPGRKNIVLSATNIDVDDNRVINDNRVMVFNDIVKCILYLNTCEEDIYIIGGGAVYTYFLMNGLIQRIYLSMINIDLDCGINLDIDYIRDNYRLVSSDASTTEMNASTTNEFVLNVYEYVNKEELSVNKLISRALTSQHATLDRTAVGTSHVFGAFLEFDLRNDTLPACTSKRISIKNNFIELMWMLSGSTDATVLERQNIRIWARNTSREFLDARGLTNYPVGDIGPTYGFNIRHFGAEYRDCKADYTGEGTDQLAQLIEGIRGSKLVHNRRLLINLWNPEQLDACALPPCLFCYIFNVTDDGYLNCMMIQRSSDISLAGGWNILTGSLLVHMLARICGYRPGVLYWSIGDVHIYTNQQDYARKLVSREPRCFPKLYFTEDAPRDSILDFRYEHLQIVGYKPYKAMVGTIN